MHASRAQPERVGLDPSKFDSLGPWAIKQRVNPNGNVMIGRLRRRCCACLLNVVLPWQRWQILSNLPPFLGLPTGPTPPPHICGSPSLPSPGVLAASADGPAGTAGFAPGCRKSQREPRFVRAETSFTTTERRRCARARVPCLLRCGRRRRYWHSLFRRRDIVRCTSAVTRLQFESKFGRSSRCRRLCCDAHTAR